LDRKVELEKELKENTRNQLDRKITILEVRFHYCFPKTGRFGILFLATGFIPVNTSVLENITFQRLLHLRGICVMPL